MFLGCVQQAHAHATASKGTPLTCEGAAWPQWSQQRCCGGPEWRTGLQDTCASKDGTADSSTCSSRPTCQHARVPGTPRIWLPCAILMPVNLSRRTCDSVEEWRKHGATCSRLGPGCRLLVICEAVLDGRIDAKHARQPVGRQDRTRRGSSDTSLQQQHGAPPQLWRPAARVQQAVTQHKQECFSITCQSSRKPRAGIRHSQQLPVLEGLVEPQSTNV